MADNVRVGKPQVEPDRPSHVSGVVEGNSRGHYEKQVGHAPDGRSAAARSTGVAPEAREVIDPTMPRLSPP